MEVGQSANINPYYADSIIPPPKQGEEGKIISKSKMGPDYIVEIKFDSLPAPIKVEASKLKQGL